MRQGFTAILSAILTAAVPTLLLAKGDTVKITIESPALAAPIEITDPAVPQFNIWSGFIIDSNKRLEEIPQGLRQYRVSFYEGCDPKESSACHTAEPSLAYVVTYAYDASAEGDGFVYLPGGHDEFAGLNMRHIYRGKGY